MNKIDLIQRDTPRVFEQLRQTDHEIEILSPYISLKAPEGLDHFKTQYGYAIQLLAEQIQSIGGVITDLAFKVDSADMLEERGQFRARVSIPWRIHNEDAQKNRIQDLLDTLDRGFDNIMNTRNFLKDKLHAIEAPEHKDDIRPTGTAGGATLLAGGTDATPQEN